MLNCKQIRKFNKENCSFGENIEPCTIEVNKMEMNSRAGKDLLNKKSADGRLLQKYRPQKSHQIKKSLIL